MGDVDERIESVVPQHTSFYRKSRKFHGFKVKNKRVNKELDEDGNDKEEENGESESALYDKKDNNKTEKKKDKIGYRSWPPPKEPTTYDEHYDWAAYTKKNPPTLVNIVTREIWGAVEPVSEDPVEGPPLSKVLVFYTGMNACYTKAECCEAMRQLQKLYMEERKLSDIPWNFLIGCDGRVYEGRGWGLHPKKVNSLYKFRKHEGKSYDIAYMGPYFRARKNDSDDRSVWPKLSFTRPMYHALRVLMSTGIKSNFIDDGYGLISQVGC